LYRGGEHLAPGRALRECDRMRIVVEVRRRKCPGDPRMKVMDA
jgi:hypothetical protein